MAGLRLAARHWDHVVPLATRDLEGFGDYSLQRRDATPNLWKERDLDGGETSFSSYTRARAAGDTSVTALPVFIMRGFRHRCIITTKTSGNESAADLAGKRIGLTGWPDSGNTWTRAILRRAGVGVADAEWRVGALTSAHPIVDRIGGVRAPTNVSSTENDEPLMDMLQRGALDAVMTPFMPPGFYDTDSPFRTLYRDARAAEIAYFESTGYVPGIHVLAMQTSVLKANPDIADDLVQLFDEAKQLAHSRRIKLLDVTPWQNEAFAITTQTFGDDWMPYGWTPNRIMIDDFQTELVAQGLLDSPVPNVELFPYQTEVAGSLTKVAS